MIEALSVFIKDLDGSSPASDEELIDNLYVIKEAINVSYYTSFSELLFEYTDLYEDINPPLYHNGVQYWDHELPPHDQALLFLQSWLMEFHCVPGNSDAMDGVVFEHREVIPGPVHDTVQRQSQCQDRQGHRRVGRQVDHSCHRCARARTARFGSGR